MSEVIDQIKSVFFGAIAKFRKISSLEENEPTPIRPAVHALAGVLNAGHGVYLSAEAQVMDQVNNNIKPFVTPVFLYAEQNPEIFGFGMAAFGSVFTLRSLRFSPRRMVRGGIIGGLIGFGILFRAARRDGRELRDD
mmetsp:Transcript_17198/g.21182  ORF Transcript_17198/g.21182 Transcript_17198/m.21182 type:complete len:137 (+) Transcript_17198:306-716(+)|eukprot:CAMPEP_0204851840 /NCGR_PEP_ID=MMETSP1347-20130617/10735_1 /ASSEMBLY_ACC=CAM_ASM_000690 /TAXON_ID=215587 /ORGANISM="Aplanochytrium stocchinoi, Strain GSBS06" /LENGTH=136 /DNA_ID=CAMNT_0051995755 /DNA_START=291 /DNA_END=701 /DNA_ORIENTATION=+